MKAKVIALANELDVRTTELMAAVEMLADMERENDELKNQLGFAEMQIKARNAVIKRLERRLEEMEWALMITRHQEALVASG